MLTAGRPLRRLFGLLAKYNPLYKTYFDLLEFYKSLETMVAGTCNLDKSCR